MKVVGEGVVAEVAASARGDGDERRFLGTV